MDARYREPNIGSKRETAINLRASWDSSKNIVGRNEQLLGCPSALCSDEYNLR